MLWIGNAGWGWEWKGTGDWVDSRGRGLGKESGPQQSETQPDHLHGFIHNRQRYFVSFTISPFRSFVAQSINLSSTKFRPPAWFPCGLTLGHFRDFRRNTSAFVTSHSPPSFPDSPRPASNFRCFVLHPARRCASCRTPNHSSDLMLLCNHFCARKFNILLAFSSPAMWWPCSGFFAGFPV